VDEHDISDGGRFVTGIALSVAVMAVIVVAGVEPVQPPRLDGTTGASLRQSATWSPGRAGPGLTDALWQRRSTRVFDGNRPLAYAEVCQMLVRAPVPPMLEVFVAHASGVYRFDRELGRCVAVPGRAVGVRERMSALSEAPAVLLVTGARSADTLVHAAAGELLQAVALQAVVHGLGTCVVAGFDGDEVRELLGLAADRAVLYVMPVGHSEQGPADDV